MVRSHIPDLSKPVLASAMERDEFLRLLTETVEQMYPLEHRKQGKQDRGTHSLTSKLIRKTQVRYNACRSTIEKFTQFLTDKQICQVVIDEELFQSFQDHLIKSGIPDSYHRNHRSQIRKLVNALPSNLLQRKLVPLAEFRKAHKWDKFSADTPKILEDFVRNGRKLKTRSSRQAPELSSVLLSKPYREQIANETLTFLRAIEATDILQISADDVEEFIDDYESEGKRHTAIGILDYIRPLFSNLLAKGLIKTDPLVDVPRKEKKENLDYVDQAGIDKLADLSTLDMNDFMDVRGRVLAFSLYYDFALRNREGSLLKTGDLKLDDITSLVLPKAIQKVQREDSLLFSYFPHVTRPLLERYLQLRASKSPTTNNLIVTDEGTPMAADGCRGVVRNHCEKLGVKTYEGKTPTPHRLRHSFGTLNHKPLGCCLDIVEIKEQYRHSTIETTYRLYFAKNPILKKQRYVARMQSNGSMGTNVSGQTSTSVIPQSIKPVSLNASDCISENEAMRQVRGIGLDYRSLREYALKVGSVQKNGRGYEYSKSFITDLANSYFTRKEAMDFLNMDRNAFFNWTKDEDVKFIQIGQVGLFRKDRVLAKKRSR